MFLCLFQYLNFCRCKSSRVRSFLENHFLKCCYLILHSGAYTCLLHPMIFTTPPWTYKKDKHFIWSRHSQITVQKLVISACWLTSFSFTNSAFQAAGGPNVSSSSVTTRVVTFGAWSCVEVSAPALDLSK